MLVINMVYTKKQKFRDELNIYIQKILYPRDNTKAMKIIKMDKLKHRIMLEDLDNVFTNYPEKT